MIREIFALLLLAPIILSASEGAEGGTDFWWRLFNFAIFAGILYYLLADKIKDFFAQRSNSIAGELSTVQEKLKEAKAKKEEALKSVDEAKEKADEIIELAKKEAVMLSEKIAKDSEAEVAYLEKSFEDRVEIETKKMKQDVVNELLGSLFDKDGVKISNDDLLNIIKKKVA